MSKKLTLKERSVWLHTSAEVYFKWKREGWLPLANALRRAKATPNKMIRVRPGIYVVVDRFYNPNLECEVRYVYLCCKVGNEYLIVRINGGCYELRAGSERTLKDILISFEIPF